MCSESSRPVSSPDAGVLPPSPLGLYLHIPFCSAICHYCNFNRGLLDEALKRRYVDALEREILREGDGAAADTIYFGGGTPSLLEPDEIARLIRACARAYRLTADTEVTLEVNPETVDVERMRKFRDAGINRLSIGVQSFRDEELRRLGRVHDAARAARAYEDCRRAGFDNISLDLMMWLPQQTVADWLTSIDRLIALAPDHASLYLLELYPNAPLKDDMARSQWSQAAEDDAADMYLEGFSRLDDAGYRQYEISNVCRPGRASRHNLKYWQDGEWMAFGCGAHGTRNGRRWKNDTSTADYVHRIDAGASVAVDERMLDHEERMQDALFMGLRLTEGVDVDRVRRKFGVNVSDRYGRGLQPFLDAGILVADAGVLRLTRQGMLLANEVCRVFV